MCICFASLVTFLLSSCSPGAPTFISWISILARSNFPWQRTSNSNNSKNSNEKIQAQVPPGQSGLSEAWQNLTKLDKTRKSRDPVNFSREFRSTSESSSILMLGLVQQMLYDIIHAYSSYSRFQTCCKWPRSQLPSEPSPGALAFTMCVLPTCTCSACANLCHTCALCAWKIVSASSVSALFMQTSKTQLYTEASTYSTCTIQQVYGMKWQDIFGQNKAPKEPTLQDGKAWKSSFTQIQKIINHPSQGAQLAACCCKLRRRPTARGTSCFWPAYGEMEQPWQTTIFASCITDFKNAGASIACRSDEPHVVLNIVSLAKIYSKSMQQTFSPNGNNCGTCGFSNAALKRSSDRSSRPHFTANFTKQPYITFGQGSKVKASLKSASESHTWYLLSLPQWRQIWQLGKRQCRERCHLQWHHSIDRKHDSNCRLWHRPPPKIKLHRVICNWKMLKVCVHNRLWIHKTV